MWKPLDFTDLQNRLLDLKYRCLHASNIGRTKIKVESDDIRDKFKLRNVTYKLRDKRCHK